ncbi:MAG: hypothetical protein H0X33_13215 [Taibaiella sp.]|nr:hypothetical protein [Taibaiella sp.]
MRSEKLPPLKAKEAGRSGHKHTLASFPVDESGEPLVRLLCVKPGCGCSGTYSIQELLEHLGYFKELEKGKEAA